MRFSWMGELRELTGPSGGETIYARKVVLAGGRDGSGAPHRPAFPSLPRESRAGGSCVFHSSDSIDFARLKGGRIGVLGASASAFDNAAVALESGAAEAHLFVRRPHGSASIQSLRRGRSAPSVIFA
jgi:cation diffusion facilitator CzcD-associated flavoprotein CzcO